MNNIGIVTLFGNNYGSILQCYSTKSFVESLGYQCHVLYLKQDNEHSLTNTVKRLVRFLYKSLRYKDYLQNTSETKRVIKIETSYLSEQSRKFMSDFVEKQLKPEGYTWNELLALGGNKEYSSFIVGSDQVWNSSRYINTFKFLTFTEKKKRIAFAPSFGSTEIADFNIKIVIDGINGFEKVSVREESGKDIIKKLTGKDAIRLDDPTVLKDKRQWEEFAKNGTKKDESYIFVHFLNTPNEVALNSINYLSSDLNLRVYCFAYDYDAYAKLKNAAFENGSPCDYVSLISNASFVFTDSFHTTLFSMNLGRPFFTFHRQYIHKHSQEGRISDLLDRYRLSERLIENEGDFKLVKDKNINDVDFEKVRKKMKDYLSKEIIRTKGY